MATPPPAITWSGRLNAGKHVVTANKEVMSRRGPFLMQLAQRQRVQLLFEASAGGGIPIVGCLMSQLLGNDIHSIRSIINGTTNYILTRMAREQTPFDQAPGRSPVPRLRRSRPHQRHRRHRRRL